MTDLWHVLQPATATDDFILPQPHPLIDPSWLQPAKNSATFHPASGINCAEDIPQPPEAVAPIITGCSLIRGLVEKVTRERNLKHTERLALLYTLGHCGDAGRSYIHQLIALCSNYDPRTTERFIQRLEPGHRAIRCSTLKEWLKDYLPGVSCECKTKKKNPSPIDGLSSKNKKEKANQPRKSAPPVSEQDWETIALDLFAFTEDESDE